MKMDVTEEKLNQLVKLQLSNHFGVPNINIEKAMKISLERIEKNFTHSNNKYYFNNEGVFFSPYHSGQYSIFLYYLSNTLFKLGKTQLASQVYYLNKIFNSVDWYFEIELPDIFGVEHPLGSVLGRAKYSDGFFIYQGCTVGGGNALKPQYPSIGSNVIMYSNSKILGNSSIGNNVIIAADTTILNQDIPDNCLVFGKSPNLTIKEKDEDYMNEYIASFWKIEMN